MKEFKGVIALPPTPLDDDGKIDKESLRSVIDFDLENGCHGVGVLAAAGEGYLLPDEDWKTVVKTAVDHMDGRGPLMVGCASMSTGRAVELIRAADDFGADAILAFNPQGMRIYSENELYRHFKALTDATDIHIVAYARADDPIPFGVLKRLVNEERVSHIKNGYLDCAFLQKLDESLGDKLYKFCGVDHWTLRFLLLGCKGIMTATASVLPEENVKLLSLVQEGKIDEARKLWYEKYLTWNDSGFFENWQWAHKYALKLMGVIKSDKVLPPQSLGAEYHKKEIESLLKHQRII